MKTKRQAKILELIKKNNIETQEELSDYLEREGYQVTQATVSRDIRELKLTKVAVDAMHLHEVVGCIAGDDTIMCAVRSVQETVEVMGRLRKIVEE